MDQTTAIKPGYTTTEFWVTILTNVLAGITLVFHKTFDVNVQQTAGALAGLVTAAYTLSRSHIKAAAQASNTVVTNKAA